jgi:hypothetical protein
MVAEVGDDSPALRDKHRTFEGIIDGNVRVVNFYEQRPMQIIKLWLIRWQEFVRPQY